MRNYRFIISLHNYVAIFNSFGSYYINCLWTHHQIQFIIMLFEKFHSHFEYLKKNTIISHMY